MPPPGVAAATAGIKRDADDDVLMCALAPRVALERRRRRPSRAVALFVSLGSGSGRPPESTSTSVGRSARARVLTSRHPVLPSSSSSSSSSSLRDALELSDALGLSCVVGGAASKRGRLEDQCLLKMKGLTLELDISNDAGGGGGGRGAGVGVGGRRASRASSSSSSSRRRSAGGDELSARVKLDLGAAAFPAASSAVDPAVRRHATGGGWPMGSGPPRGVMCVGGPGGTSGAWSLELRRATRDSVLGLERGLARLGGRDLRCLVSLSLRNGGKGLGDDGVSHLARALRDAVPRLKSLCLAGNDVGVDGAKALSEALAGRTRADASEDVVGGVAVGGVALEELDLSGNSIGGEGTCALADALNTTGCAKLRALNLARCAIGARGAVAIAEIIRGQARSIRWSPYDRVGVANADP